MEKAKQISGPSGAQSQVSGFVGFIRKDVSGFGVLGRFRVRIFRARAI